MGRNMEIRKVVLDAPGIPHMYRANIWCDLMGKMVEVKVISLRRNIHMTRVKAEA